MYPGYKIVLTTDPGGMIHRIGYYIQSPEKLDRHGRNRAQEIEWGVTEEAAILSVENRS
jgi:hypothetical protein